MIAIQNLGVVDIDAFNCARRIYPFCPASGATRPTLFKLVPVYINLENFSR
jgi:hypothetical protein